MTLTPAPIGHNSGRLEDIERTAHELHVRAEYHRKWTQNAKLPPVVRALNAAWLSGEVSPAEFFYLYGITRNGGGGGCDITISNEDFAILSRNSIRANQKHGKKLVKEGWLKKSSTFKADGGQSVNAYSLTGKNAVIKILQNIDIDTHQEDGGDVPQVHGGVYLTYRGGCTWRTWGDVPHVQGGMNVADILL